MQLSKAPKIPRNSLCSCGSGIKYKKCCLKKQQEQFRQQVKAMRMIDNVEKKASKTEVENKEAVQDGIEESQSTEVSDDQGSRD